MNAKVEKLENNKVKLEITVSADKFEEGLNQAYFKNAKYFSVPGFRKGKAPRNIVEKHYGVGILYEDAFNIGQKKPPPTSKKLHRDHLLQSRRQPLQYFLRRLSPQVWCTVPETAKPSH